MLSRIDAKMKMRIVRRKTNALYVMKKKKEKQKRRERRRKENAFSNCQFFVRFSLPVLSFNTIKLAKIRFLSREQALFSFIVIRAILAQNAFLSCKERFNESQFISKGRRMDDEQVEYE